MNTLCDAQRSSLVVIDLQERLMPAIHDSTAVVNKALTLTQAAKLLAVPVIGTAQNPTRLGTNLPDIHALCDTVIEKMDFDACAEPAFLQSLPSGRDELVVIGCEAHVCVLQTVFGLLRRQYRVRLAVDAMGSRQPQDKAIALQRAQAAGAELITAEMAVFEWLRDCRHPRFREALGLIK